MPIRGYLPNEDLAIEEAIFISILRPQQRLYFRASRCINPLFRLRGRVICTYAGWPPIRPLNTSDALFANVKLSIRITIAPSTLRAEVSPRGSQRARASLHVIIRRTSNSPTLARTRTSPPCVVAQPRSGGIAHLGGKEKYTIAHNANNVATLSGNREHAEISFGQFLGRIFFFSFRN